MYPNTLTGLFDAVQQGTLRDVLLIIESKQVNLNELNDKGLHIVNYLLDLSDKINDIQEKIGLLIEYGAIPLINDKSNLLLLICKKINNKTLRINILDILEKHP